MRGLERGVKPTALKDRQAALQDRYVNDGKSSWREGDIVESLRRDARRKCMYCEAFIDVVSYAAVEHIRPKKHFPNLALQWENLGFCCPRCNTNKGDYWTDSDTLRLLDPYSDSVEEHITFAGPMAHPQNSSSRGKNTLRKLKFSEREDLLISRMIRIEALALKVDRWRSETDPEVKEVLAEDVRSGCADSVEFAGALRVFAKWKDFPL